MCISLTQRETQLLSWYSIATSVDKSDGPVAKNLCNLLKPESNESEKEKLKIGGWVETGALAGFFLIYASNEKGMCTTGNPREAYFTWWSRHLHGSEVTWASIFPTPHIVCLLSPQVITPWVLSMFLTILGAYFSLQGPQMAVSSL